MPKQKLPEIVFDEATHTYLVDGIEMPSVTQVTAITDKVGLDRWRVETAVQFVIDKVPGLISGDLANQPEDIEAIHREAVIEPARIAHEAGDFGKQTHALITKYLRAGRKPKCPTPALDTALNGFRIWKQRHKIEVLALEEPTFNKTQGYCGRPDFRGRIDGREAILDWKSGRFVKDAFGMQLAAYAATAEENEGLKIERLGVIQIDERGLPHWRNLGEERERYWQRFLALLRFWKL